MYFLSYLIVSSIQMGATIDYAIVITNRYIDLRKTITDKREAVVKTLDQSFATIITSGSIMTSAGFVVVRPPATRLLPHWERLLEKEH